MGWTMRALVWRFTKLFEKWGDHHHRSGEEEPLVERRKEGLALSIKEESESFVTFYQERKWKFCHDNCLSCWVLIVSAWHGLVAKVLAINVQNLVSLLKQLRPGVIIIRRKSVKLHFVITAHYQFPSLIYWMTVGMQVSSIKIHNWIRQGTSSQYQYCYLDLVIILFVSSPNSIQIVRRQCCLN